MGKNCPLQIWIKSTNLQPFFNQILQTKNHICKCNFSPFLLQSVMEKCICQSRNKASKLTYVGRPTDFQSTSSIHQFFLNRLHNHTSYPFWTIVFFTPTFTSEIFLDCAGFFLISFSAPHVWETQFAVYPDKNKCELPLEKRMLQTFRLKFTKSS